MLPWWWSPQRMMSNNVSESEKEIPTGCVSFYTQWFDVCVCIRVRGLHLVFYFYVCVCVFLPMAHRTSGQAAPTELWGAGGDWICH